VGDVMPSPKAPQLPLFMIPKDFLPRAGEKSSGS
jgi:hypothetical protein